MTALSFKRVFVAALAVTMMSVPARAQSVDVDIDKSVDFRAYKTYAWGTINMSEDTSPLTAQRIVTAVERQMGAIGFQKVEKAPDVRIAIQSTTREELVYWGGGPYWGAYPYWWGGWSPWWGGGYSTFDVQRVLIGRLTLDMIDTRTDRVVLRGVAEDEVSSKARKNERKAYDAVAEIFEESPWGADFDDD
jgi:hypothetical protein